MNYWWVNHKQTFRQEFGGKYVWCPKLKSNGSINHFYETMREVQPGDLVYSYANKRKGVRQRNDTLIKPTDTST